MIGSSTIVDGAVLGYPGDKNTKHFTADDAFL